MKITSSAFGPGQPIPRVYSQHAEGFSPPLMFSEVPAATKTLALIVEDPDAPGGTFTHWVLFNIDPAIGVLLENSVPVGARQGMNSAEVTGYRGPKPPSGTHRYFFRLYAIDCVLPLEDGATRQEVEGALAGHVLADCSLVGTFSTDAGGFR